MQISAISRGANLYMPVVPKLAPALVNPTPVVWTNDRPFNERVATTGTIQTTDKPTVAKMRVSLLANGTYSFNAQAQYTLANKEPGKTLTLTTLDGRIIKKTSGASLSLSRAESSRLTSGDYILTFEIKPVVSKGGWISSYKLSATQKLSELPKSSGDANIDALLAGGTNWWHDIGAVATPTNIKVTDKANQVSGARTTLYYGFLDGQENYLSEEEKNGFLEMDFFQKEYAKAAIYVLSTFVNIKFIEDKSKADIVFGTNNQVGTVGTSNLPMQNQGSPSIIMLDNNEKGGNPSKFPVGALGDAFYTFFANFSHQICHAMGLKDASPNTKCQIGNSQPYLKGSQDNNLNTLMSFKNAPHSYRLDVQGNNSEYTYQLIPTYPSLYTPADIAALQYMYGAKTEYEGNPSNYFYDSNSEYPWWLYQTLWAPNGTRLNYFGSRDCIVDLRPGGYSSMGLLRNTDLIAGIKDNFLKQGVSEEKAKIYADNIINKNPEVKSKIFNASKTVALAYGSYYSVVRGGRGNDKFYAGNYSTTVDGGAGKDTLYLIGSAKDWITTNLSDGQTYTQKKTGQVITAKGIEAIAYYKANALAL